MTDVAKIEQQIAKLKKRKQRLMQRQSAEQRKRETRAKIVLGGAAIAFAKRHPDKGAQLTQLLKDCMTDKDRQFVEAWQDEQNNEV